MRFRTKSSVAALAALLALAAPAAADDYVALGDSYSSGVGTGTYDLSSTCKRSTAAYPSLHARAYGHALTFRACTGATTVDVLDTQVSALTGATDLVTMTAGGNDAGFASVVTACNLEWNCYDDIDVARSFITNQLPGRLNTLYREIAARAPAARVRILGYPRIFKEQRCTFYSAISAAEQVAMNDVAELLRDVLRARATAWGFGFVDVTAPFTGHEVCTADAWLTGIVSPTSDSYHPNQAGHRSGYWPSLRASL